VQFLVRRGRDTERLFHETIGFVTVSIRLIDLKVSPVGRMIISIGRGTFIPTPSTAAFALHFAVGEEGARDSACTPRLAVRPSTHARLSFVPDKHTARADRRSLLLREPSLHTREDAEATGLKHEDGICRSAHMAIVCLHTTGTAGPSGRLRRFR
jgi:hypothetical protein